MKYLHAFIALCAITVSAFPQTAPRPRFATKPEVKEQKQAATKPAPVAKAAVANLKKEILQLEHEWALALLQEDAAKLDSLLGDNLQYTRANGKVENKSSYLKSIREGITKYSLIKRDEVKVEVNGETAIVTARWRTTLQNKPNPPMTTSARYLHVYVKQDGRWVITKHQTTEIK